MKKYDVIIVGGGASGMMAAIQCGIRKRKTLMIEHKDRLGKKILATGNGKCNYTNLIQKPDCYRGTHPEFAMDILEQFTCEQTLDFFETLGIMPKIRDGYVYPNSEQAASVADVLVLECRRYNIDILLSQHVEQIKKRKDVFLVSAGDNIYESSSVILATGGCAAPKQGSDGSGLNLAKELGHTMISAFPALVQLKSKEKYGKIVSGVRCQAKAALQLAKKTIASEQGEFLFTDYGISGIPVLQMSRFAVNAVLKKQIPTLHLDFFPQFTKSEFYEYLLKRFRQANVKTVEEAMLGMLNQKLNYLVLKQENISISEMAHKLSQDKVLALTEWLKNFQLTIDGFQGFDQAQVSAGGVDTKEVKVTTLESKKVPHLYFAGEILDIDGTCGGYNLQWAWSSGYVAGKNA